MKGIRIPRFSLRARFVLGMGVMLLPLVVLAISAFFSLQTVIQGFDQVVQESTAEINVAARLQVLIRRARIVAHDYFIPGFGSQDERGRFLDISRQVEDTFQEARTGVFHLEEERTLIQSAYLDWHQGRSIGEAILATANAGRNPTAGRNLMRMDAHLDRALEMLDRLHGLSIWEMDRRLEDAREVRRRASLIIASAFAVGLGAAILGGMSLARSILLPLRALGAAADRFGSGDLSHRVTLAARDELGELSQAFNDMAEKLAKIQEELEVLSIHDGLTGLYNFREFHRQLAEEAERSWRYSRPFSLLMVDFDHFKTVNDTFGHLAGDEALRGLASLIRRAVRPADRVARYGGEELAIILPETPRSGALAMAERIRAMISNHPIPVTPEEKVDLTVSIGAATYPDDADTAEKLIGAADQALYAAKQAGRNLVRQFGKT